VVPRVPACVAAEGSLTEMSRSREAETLVMMPLRKELEFVLGAYTRLEHRALGSALGRLQVVRLPELGLTLASGGTGKAQFALQTQHLLDTDHGWGLVVCAGAAGALADEVLVGDVVVATATLEHDYQNKFNSRPMPRFEGAPAAIAELRLVSAQQPFGVHFGTVASGDEDVVDHARRLALCRQTKALAVAWEGAGGARACRFSQVPFLEIRGITDTAGSTAPSDFDQNLELAMTNLVTLLLSWTNLRLKRQTH
jgi:adenosylhomocysteine nucleosidase